MLHNFCLHHLYKFQVATTPCGILYRSTNNEFRSIKDNKGIATDTPNTQKAESCLILYEFYQRIHNKMTELYTPKKYNLKVISSS